MGGGRWRLARAAAALGRLLFWKVHLFLPLQGVGWGKIRKVCPPRSPDIQLFALGGFGGVGVAEALGGGGCWGDGGEGMCCERAGFESAGAGGLAWADIAERARVDPDASRSWWVSFESARVKSLTFKNILVVA